MQKRILGHVYTHLTTVPLLPENRAAAQNGIDWVQHLYTGKQALSKAYQHTVAE